MGVALFIWGGVLLGCIGATGFASLMALRFLLGYGLFIRRRWSL